MNFTHEDYLNEDWFGGEESEVSCRTQKIVKVRKEHECWLSLCPGNTPHKIAIGTEAYYEKALIDRSFWGKFYMCKDCMDKQLTEYYGEDEE